MKPVRIFSLSLVLISSLAALAQEPNAEPSTAQSPAPRVVDLKAPDGSVLKATYFSAAKPGPGVLLFHQSNRTRKS